MNWIYHKNTFGIMGTIIVHLVLAIIFMSIKLSADYKNLDEAIQIDLSSLEELLAEEMPEIQLPDEDQNEETDPFRDIAVNVSDIPDEPFDIDAYMEQLKNEMIEAGEIGEDNYIDMMKERALRDAAENDIAYIDRDPLEKESQNAEKAADMAADYQGPTRIYYNLLNRTHMKLPLPVYKCPESGKVTLSITVNQYGTVINAEVLADESSTDDFCLHETAREAALNSRFNSGTNFPERQKGTITYIFASQ